MHLYGLDYIRAQSGDDQWAFYLNVAEVADKYEAKELETKTFKQFSQLARYETSLDCIMALVEDIRQRGYAKDVFQDLRDDLLERHLVNLIKYPKFRTPIEADKEAPWNCVDRLVPPYRLVEKVLVTCDGCGKTTYEPPKSLDCRICQCGKFLIRQFNSKFESCWVRWTDRDVEAAKVAKKRKNDASAGEPSKRVSLGKR